MVDTQVTKQHSWLANLPGRHKILLAIFPLLTLVVLASLGTFNALRLQQQTSRWVQHTYQVLLTIDEARQAYQISVISVRGYVLSPGPDELAAYENGKQQFAQTTDRLRTLTLDNPLQQVRIDRLLNLVTQWENEIGASVIAPLRDQQQTDPAQALAQRIRIRDDYLAHSTSRAPAINAVLGQMTDTEQSLLATRNRVMDSTLRALRIGNAIAALAALLFGMYAISMTKRLVTSPLRQITDLMNRVAASDTSVVVTRLGRRDEIGEIARGLQVFKQMVMDAKDQNWLKTQVTTVSHRLQQATTHREFGGWLVSELVPLFKGGVGLFYAYDDTRLRLDLLGSYGLRLDSRATDQYVPGEGLVGQCATDRKPILLDNLPENYVHIDSGSGEAAPRNIAILPVLYRGCLIGVLELAGFSALTPLQLLLLDELLPIVALTLENLNRAIDTQDLLERTKEQADELRVSELVMRQQKEVLRDNNDALQAKTAELEEQSEQLIASEEELRVQAEELLASNEELREKTDTLNRQKHVLEDLQRDTADKADELARASQYKSDFLANMSHELRTPLNSLLILSRNLADNDTGNLDEEQIESARIINDAGTSLLHLINDILDLSKIEAGKMELLIDELPLADLQRRLQRTFSHVAEKKGLGFTVEIEPGLPTVLRTDSAKLEQIANNLLSNAFKFTAQGAVAVRIGRPGSDITVPDTLADQPVIAMTVSDTGIGIPADKFQNIFNAFEQVDASTSRQFGGTGLGLAISRRMSMLLGGDIVLHSESGRGSSFSVLLPETPPVERAENAPRAETPTLARPMSAHLLPDAVEDDRRSLQPGQITILVIEDDPPFARILIDMIHR
ncbi:MAG: ATP-binding protein, partial [Rhodanobacter sp.]